MIDPRSLGSWCILGTDESTLSKDSSVPLSREGVFTSFLSSPKLHICNMIEREDTKKKDNNLFTFIIKKCQQPVLVLCFYPVLVEFYWYSNANAVI